MSVPLSVWSAADPDPVCDPADVASWPPMPELAEAAIPAPDVPVDAPSTVDPAEPDLTAPLWCRDLRVPGLGTLTLSARRGDTLALVSDDPKCRRRVATNLLGLVGIRSGELYVDGVAFHCLDDEHRDEIRAAHAGFVLSDLALVPTMTVLENLTLAPLDAEPLSSDAAIEVLERVGLGAHADTVVDSLSDVDEVTARLARALVRCPALVLIDTTTGNLDAAQAETLWSTAHGWISDHPAALVLVGPESHIPRWVDRRVDLKSALES